MVNPHRGEIAAVIDGREQVLCLTLGALAELEASFGVASLPALVERLSRTALTSKQVCAIIAAGLRGGGSAISAADVAAMPFEGGASGMTELVARLLSATFSAPRAREEGGDAGDGVTPNPR